uniref:Immunoglobulin domain-containing protein n=1 Tax=Scleropages formosus TaxID=113540 RepID=A0A8C9W9Y0_SCLFO
VNFVEHCLSLGAHCNYISCPVELRVKEHGSLTIECSYDKSYKNKDKYWCKGRRFWDCTILEDTRSSKNNHRISISDDKKKTYSVTMNDLTENDNGTYWCGIELFLKDKNCQMDIVVEKDLRINSNVEQATTNVSTVTVSSAHTTEIHNEIGTGIG